MLQQLAQDLNAVADAHDRLARQKRVEVRIEIPSLKAQLLELVRREQLGEVISEVDRRRPKGGR